MKLSEFLSNFPSAEFKSLTQDSRKVAPGTVFVAIRGTIGDGHAFLNKATELGAAALVVEDAASVPNGFKGPVVVVPSTRKALEVLAEKFFDKPAQSLTCIAVTGTNGKTTVTYMVERILSSVGLPCGVLGTIDHHLGDRVWESQLTTPDPITLHQRLKEFKDLNAKAAAFEISSHALEQARAESLPIQVAIYTNFTRDHLDYHKTMENYFAAKQRLFTDLIKPDGTAVINADDAQVAKVKIKTGATRWTYGQKNADFQFKILNEDLDGSVFELKTPKGECKIKLPTSGLHNVYNAVAAIAAAVSVGVKLEDAVKAIATFRGAPGRLQKVANSRGLHIFVDYAHTDDALTTVLSALNRLRGPNKKARIFTVFGCGGDRDKGKRPLMAKAAAEFSDVLFVTSDNPRTENPETILDEIAAGIPSTFKGELKREVNRRSALHSALQMAKEGDVILVAGKGHEDYQILGTTKYPFSDAKVLSELLNE